MQPRTPLTRAHCVSYSTPCQPEPPGPQLGQHFLQFQVIHESSEGALHPILQIINNLQITPSFPVENEMLQLFQFCSRCPLKQTYTDQTNTGKAATKPWHWGGGWMQMGGMAREWCPFHEHPSGHCSPPHWGWVGTVCWQP